jgi:hypothetical protein
MWRDVRHVCGCYVIVISAVLALRGDTNLFVGDQVRRDESSQSEMPNLVSWRAVACAEHARQPWTSSKCRPAAVGARQALRSAQKCAAMTNLALAFHEVSIVMAPFTGSDVPASSL